MAELQRDPREFGRVTLVLGETHNVFLDSLVEKINRKNKLRKSEKVSRSDVVRALIEALKASKVDLSDATSEAEMTEILLAAIGQ